MQASHVVTACIPLALQSDNEGFHRKDHLGLFGKRGGGLEDRDAQSEAGVEAPRPCCSAGEPGGPLTSLPVSGVPKPYKDPTSGPLQLLAGGSQQPCLFPHKGYLSCLAFGLRAVF